jgi:WD40 repeat protein
MTDLPPISPDPTAPDPTDPNPISPPLSDTEVAYPMAYQVGGSLREDTRTYVVRQADHDLYEGLRAGLFCYVLNSRQMGKSSLRVRTMAKLKAEGYACVAFEMRELCIYQVSADEFYGGFVSHLASEFDLPIDLETWWNQQQLLHPFLRLVKFIEEILLNAIESPIVIFIDEIDSILNLEFKDDFFAFLRSCYHKRADKPQFQRLNFACLGVATPMDLIADSSFTPLNLDSRAIELMGFQLTEAQPLTEGLRARAANPEAVMAAILDWTGGQPFLTQWVCQIIQQLNQVIPPGTEAHWVKQWVRSQIIDHWRTSDRQQHFQTIRDRILNSETLACWALGLYQQLLNQGETTVEDSRDLMQFRLSGLVVKQQGKLRIYNRIYASIFDQDWTEQSLRAIRPYGAQLLAWEQSGETRYLLKGEELQWSLNWADGLSLSNGDYQFLSASQAQELQLFQDKTELALSQEKVAIVRLNQVEQTTRKRLRTGAFWVTLAIVSTLGTALYFGRSAQQLQRNTDLLNLEQESQQILQNRSDSNQLPDLIKALKIAQRLRSITDRDHLDPWPIYKPILALQSVLSNQQEHTRWQLGHAPSCLAFSPDGQRIAVGAEDGTLTIWTTKGELLQTIAAYQPGPPDLSPRAGWPLALSWSPDGRQLAVSSSGLTIGIWDLATATLVRSFDLDQEAVMDLRFTPKGNLVAVNALGNVATWSPQGRRLSARQFDLGPTLNGIYPAEDFTLSAQGDAVVYTKVLADGQGQPEVRSVQTGQLIQQYPTIRYRPGDRVFHAFDRGVGNPEADNLGPRYTSLTYNRLNFWQADGSPRSQIEIHRVLSKGFSYNPAGDRIATIHPDGLIKLWVLNDQRTLISASPKETVIRTTSRLHFGSRARQPQALPAQASTAPMPPASPPANSVAAARVPLPVAPLPILPRPAPSLLLADRPSLQPPNNRPVNRRIVGLDLHPKTQEIALLTTEGELHRYDRRTTSIQSLATLAQTNLRWFGVGFPRPILRYSPDGTKLLIQSQAPRPGLQIRTAQGQLLREFPTQNPQPGLELSPDGQRVAIAGAQPNSMELWTLAGQRLHQVDQVEEFLFNAIAPTLITLNAVNPASKHPRPRLSIWTDRGSRLRDLSNGPKGMIFTLSAAPQGQFMAAHESGHLTAWSAQGEFLYQLNHGTGITQIAHHQSGEYFATVGLDQTIKLWRSDGTWLRTIVSPSDMLYRLQFSPNGQLLAASSSEGVYIWRTNGEFVARLDVGNTVGGFLRFSADSKRLFFPGNDGLYSWNLDLNPLIDQGCDWLQDYLQKHPQERSGLPCRS